MKDWFNKSRVTIVEEGKNKQDSETEEKKDTPSSSKEKDSSGKPSTAQHIRMRAIGELNTVVSGTGKLVQMLSENAWPTIADEEALQGSGENYLSHFVVETPHLHADDDLDAVCITYYFLFKIFLITLLKNGQPIGRKIRIPSSWLFSVLFVVLVVLLVYWYANHSVII